MQNFISSSRYQVPEAFLLAQAGSVVSTFSTQSTMAPKAKAGAMKAAAMKGAAKFTIPGLCMLKLKNKPATKAGKKEVFGKVVMVKAKPASKVVKAYCVAALKKSI